MLKAFKESILETTLMAIVIVIAIFLLVIGVIFWVNPKCKRLLEAYNL